MIDDPKWSSAFKGGHIRGLFYFEGLLQLHTRTNEMRERLWIAAEPHKKGSAASAMTEGSRSSQETIWHHFTD